MGKVNSRYCVRANKSQWQIWDRKMSKWWGKPTKEFPSKMVDRLNQGGNKSDIKY